MKNIYFSFLFLLSASVSFAQIPAYYSSIDFTQPPATVETNLVTLISNTHSPHLAYSATYPWIKLMDEDANNTSNVILLYNGVSESKAKTYGGGNTTLPEVWNREHVYPQTFITTTAKADLHHMRACDGDINNNRASLPFVNGSGNYGTATGGWYPGDEWKGDVARMIMYMHLRYNEPWSDVGNLTTFLQWNVDDPVSSIEIQRNNTIEGAQGNRNPFIDQPYLATYLWGGANAEDNWGMISTINEYAFLASVKLYPNPVKQGNDISMTARNTSQYKGIVKIYNLTGALIATEKGTRIPTKDFPRGIYFAKITDKGYQKTVKFVVE